MIEIAGVGVLVDFARLIPFMFIFPLATIINTATTTSPSMNERALLNCSIGNKYIIIGYLLQLNLTFLTA